MDVRVGLWRRLSAEELMILNCGVGEDSWESLGLQGDPTSPFWRRSALGFLWKEWCWSWSWKCVVQLSRVRLFATPWIVARQASLSIANSQNLLKLMSIESVMPSNHLILCCPLFLLPSIIPSITVFSIKSVLHIRWPKYWSFSFNISPSNEYSGLISFRDGLVGFPCSPRDSQESSPTPQYKIINSSALSLLYSPTLTSIHDCWKNHSFD